jgi:hypothetical protein
VEICNLSALRSSGAFAEKVLKFFGTSMRGGKRLKYGDAARRHALVEEPVPLRFKGRLLKQYELTEKGCQGLILILVHSMKQNVILQ